MIDLHSYLHSLFWIILMVPGSIGLIVLLASFLLLPIAFLYVLTKIIGRICSIVILAIELLENKITLWCCSPKNKKKVKSLFLMLFLCAWSYTSYVFLNSVQISFP